LGCRSFLPFALTPRSLPHRVLRENVSFFYQACGNSVPPQPSPSKLAAAASPLHLPCKTASLAFFSTFLPHMVLSSRVGRWSCRYVSDVFLLARGPFVISSGAAHFFPVFYRMFPFFRAVASFFFFGRPRSPSTLASFFLMLCVAWGPSPGPIFRLCDFYFPSLYVLVCFLGLGVSPPHKRFPVREFFL